MNTKDTNQDKKNPENLENQYSYNQLIWDLIGYMQDSQKQQQQKIVELQSQIKLFKKANSNGIIYTNSLEKRIKELEGWIEELDEQVKFMDQKQSKQDISIENINKRLNQLEIEKAEEQEREKKTINLVPDMGIYSGMGNFPSGAYGGMNPQYQKKMKSLVNDVAMKIHDCIAYTIIIGIGVALELYYFFDISKTYNSDPLTYDNTTNITAENYTSIDQ